VVAASGELRLTAHYSVFCLLNLPEHHLTAVTMYRKGDAAGSLPPQ
jgi:hypothetical protein